jgi:hypothetical protein
LLSLQNLNIVHLSIVSFLANLISINCSISNWGIFFFSLIRMTIEELIQKIKAIDLRRIKKPDRPAKKE